MPKKDYCIISLNAEKEEVAKNRITTLGVNITDLGGGRSEISGELLFPINVVHFAPELVVHFAQELIIQDRDDFFFLLAFYSPLLYLSIISVFSFSDFPISSSTSLYT